MGDSADATVPMGAPVQQFSVFLQNRAGSLEALIRLLHQSRVEMLGFSVQDSRDATVARIVTSDPEITQQIFLEKGIPHTSSQLVGDVPQIVKTRRWLARSLWLVVRDSSRRDLAGGFRSNGRL